MPPLRSSANSLNEQACSRNARPSAQDSREAVAAEWFVVLIALMRFVPNCVTWCFSHIYALIALGSCDLRTRLSRVAVCCDNLQKPQRLLWRVERNVAAKFLSRIHHFQLLRCTEARLRDRVRLGKGRELLRAPGDSPTLILSAHYIGFEAALIRLSLEVQGAVVVESTGNVEVDKALARCWSRFLHQRVVPARSGLRRILGELRSKRTVALLVEHMGNGSNYVEVALRQRMSLRMSPAIRLMLSVPKVRVVWMSVASIGAGRYVCEFEELAGHETDAEASLDALMTDVGRHLAAALPRICWNTAPLNFYNRPKA